MKHKPFFRFLCTITLWFYSIAIVQAGQVVTSDQRDWAKQALAQEANLGTIESSQSVAVLYFHNKTNQQRLNALKKGLALMLITDLSKIDTIFVVERIRIQALLDEMDIGESGLVDPATAPKVGKLLKAYYVVNGDIHDGSIEPLEIGSHLLDVPFKTVTNLPLTAGSLEDLFRMEKDLLFNIVEQLNIYVTPAQKKELEMPLSLSSAALLALFLGIDYSDKGMYSDAAEMYNRAITEDPGLKLAQDSLQELNNMGLVSSEDISRVEPEPEEIAVESGSGWGTVAAVGLALAAIGGGAALLASSSDDDEDNQDEVVVVPPEPEEPALVQPTASTETTSVQCLEDTVNFSFSASMNTDAGSVALSMSEFESSQGWDGDQNYYVSLGASEYDCDSLLSRKEELRMTLNNFAASSRAALGGKTSFTFRLIWDPPSTSTTSYY